MLHTVLIQAFCFPFGDVNGLVVGDFVKDFLTIEDTGCGLL